MLQPEQFSKSLKPPAFPKAYQKRCHSTYHQEKQHQCGSTQRRHWKYQRHERFNICSTSLFKQSLSPTRLQLQGSNSRRKSM